MSEFCNPIITLVVRIHALIYTLPNLKEIGGRTQFGESFCFTLFSIASIELSGAENMLDKDSPSLDISWETEVTNEIKRAAKSSSPALASSARATGSFLLTGSDIPTLGIENRAGQAGKRADADTTLGFPVKEET